MFDMQLVFEDKDILVNKPKWLVIKPKENVQYSPKVVPIYQDMSANWHCDYINGQFGSDFTQVIQIYILCEYGCFSKVDVYVEDTNEEANAILLKCT